MANLVYDVFLFFQEFDVLKIRLAELAEHVDVFVLIESPFSFSGKPVPLQFKENPITGYNIRHVIVEDLEFPEAYQRTPADSEQQATFNEWHIKRNGAKMGTEDADASDIILCSDADEIIRPSKIREGSLPESLMMQDWYQYWLNCKINIQWPGTSRHLGEPRYDLKYMPNVNRIENGGWHFTLFGGPDLVKNKLRTGAYQREWTPQLAEGIHVETSIQNGTDVFNSILGHRPARLAELEDTLPSVVVNNKDQWQHLIHPDWRDNGVL